MEETQDTLCDMASLLKTKLSKKDSGITRKATRLQLNITTDSNGRRYESQYISLIEAKNLTIDQSHRIFPSENYSLEEARKELIEKMEKSLAFTLNEDFKRAFAFRIGNVTIPRALETKSLVKLIEEHQDLNFHTCMKGDVIEIKFFMIDCSLEFDFLRLSLPFFKEESDLYINVSKHIKEDEKNQLDNRIIRIAKFDDEYQIRIFSSDWQVIESISLSILAVHLPDDIKILNKTYYPVKIYAQRFEEGSYDEDLENEDLLTAEQILFSEKAEMEALISKFEEINHKNQHDKVNRTQIEIFDKGHTLISSMTDFLGTMREELSPTKVKKSEASKPSEYFLGSKLFAKKGDNSSRIIEDKDKQELEGIQFNVKSYGVLGRKKEKIIRISDDLTLHVFKKKNSKEYEFHKKYLTKDIDKIEPKRAGSKKLIFYFKSEKLKPKKFMFQDSKCSNEFLRIFKKILEILDRNTSAYLGETAEPKPGYTWALKNPPLKRFNTIKEGEDMCGMTFNITNVSMNKEPQMLSLDPREKHIILSTVDDVKIRKISLKNIIYCEPDYSDSTKVSIISKEEKHEFIFMDMKCRLLFESSIFNEIMSKYKVPRFGGVKREIFKVFTTTFNVGNAEPPTNLGDWLKKSLNCDVIAIGLQECDTASWLQAITQFYDENYHRMTQMISMWQMALIVFVKKEHKKYVTNLESRQLATGIMNTLGNKGGVAIAFRILETSFCFLSCHLAAGKENMQIRKQNYFDLMKGIRFWNNKYEGTAICDYFYFLGDMNFRVEYDYFEAVKLIDANQHLDLLKYDQYAFAREKENFMTIFQEKEINFIPTYRRNRNDKGYSNKRNQCPSWTDRILHKTRCDEPAAIDLYESNEEFFSSDHRPVVCISTAIVKPPYVPDIPLFRRSGKDQGILILTGLELTYNFELREKTIITDDVIPNKTQKLSISFHGKFFTKTAATLPIDSKISSDKSKPEPLKFSEKETPFLYSIISDIRYLQAENILAKIKRGDMIIGYAEISLKELDIIKKVQFSSAVHCYGAIIGDLKGFIKYKSSD